MVFDPNIYKTVNHFSGNITNQLKVNNTGKSTDMAQPPD